MSSNLDSLRLALDHSPDNVPLLLVYGKACIDELQLPEARGSFLLALKAQPGNAEARLGLARVVMMEGKTSEAAVRLEQLIEEKPDFAPAYVMLSRIVISEGDHARAATLYEKALELDGTVQDPTLEKELGEKKGKTGGEGDNRKKAGVLSGGGTLESIEEAFDEDDNHPRGGAAFDLGLADFDKPKLSFNDVGGMEQLK